MSEIEPKVISLDNPNTRFVASMREEHPGLAKQIPAGCMDCSTAWLMALRGRADRLNGCIGRKEETVESERMGKFTVMLCHFQSGAKK